MADNINCPYEQKRITLFFTIFFNQRKVFGYSFAFYFHDRVLYIVKIQKQDKFAVNFKYFVTQQFLIFYHIFRNGVIVKIAHNQ